MVKHIVVGLRGIKHFMVWCYRKKIIFRMKISLRLFIFIYQHAVVYFIVLLSLHNIWIYFLPSKIIQCPNNKVQSNANIKWVNIGKCQSLNFFVLQFIKRNNFLSRLTVSSFLHWWFYLHSHDIHHDKFLIKQFNEQRALLLSCRAVKLYINAEKHGGRKSKVIGNLCVFTACTHRTYCIHCSSWAALRDPFVI